MVKVMSFDTSPGYRVPDPGMLLAVATMNKLRMSMRKLVAHGQLIHVGVIQ